MTQLRCAPKLAVWLVVTVVAGAAGCRGTTARSGPGHDPKSASPAAAARAEFRLYAFAQVGGTIAPCGCTTEPLGGLQYAFGYIESQSESDARLVLEPGSFLFPVENGPYWPQDEAGWEQAHDRAKLLQTRFSALGENLVSGLGPTDVVAPEGVAPLSTYPLPRVSANVDLSQDDSHDEVKIPPHRLVKLSDAGLEWTVGVTSVVDPTLREASPLAEAGTISDPVVAATSAVARMRQAGAQFTIVMAQGGRGFAESMASSNADLVVVGAPTGTDRERLGSPATKLAREGGATYVLEPGTQLQTVTELVLSVDPASGRVPKLEAWTVPVSPASLREELTRVQQRLAKFEADSQADAAFLANLRAEQSRLQSALSAKPSGAAVGTFDQVKVTCRLPVDKQAKAAMAAYDKTVAETNKQRFAGVAAPQPAGGQSGYAGIEACADCHEEAVEFWERTPHASAYETLVVDNKQFDLSCVGCHVTGFRKPGGSEVVENAGLVDVQCESCHGPGALHAEDGGEDESLIKLEAPAELCAGECHTPEHSDTFEYKAYLRDILGPGHGEAKRKLLGDGPTGHELRKAGLAKAGGSCKKMM